jgi:prefoldin subunit 5
MKEIEEINKQIASLKDSAKALTAEVKEIGVEEDKVSKMIELFKSQKV